MAIGVIFEGHGATREQYEQVVAQVAPGNRKVAGMLYHAAGLNEGGLVVIETWESQEAANKFFQEKGIAAMAAAGITAQPTFFEVFNILD